ncbi:GD22000 [Drosophila simulans]|uniref:GD22000 n=1 Tax=Drosophila simulans TaxID=7240 RepID=B4Q5K1_DROSI|nr:GD22000 [Drosophila simulans]
MGATKTGQSSIMVIAIISNVADEPHPRRLIIDEPGADTLASDARDMAYKYFDAAWFGPVLAHIGHIGLEMQAGRLLYGPIDHLVNGMRQSNINIGGDKGTDEGSANGVRGVGYQQCRTATTITPGAYDGGTPTFGSPNIEHILSCPNIERRAPAQLPSHSDIVGPDGEQFHHER